MNAANQIIHEIIDTGAKFTLHAGEVGLTQIVSDDLLERARKHKTQIKQILQALKRESRTASPKVWNLKIRTSDGKTIDKMNMIDPVRMSRAECERHLGLQFGKDRIIEFKEVKK